MIDELPFFAGIILAYLSFIFTFVIMYIMGFQVKLVIADWVIATAEMHMKRTLKKGTLKKGKKKKKQKEKVGNERKE